MPRRRDDPTDRDQLRIPFGHEQAEARMTARAVTRMDHPDLTPGQCAAIGRIAERIILCAREIGPDAMTAQIKQAHLTSRVWCPDEGRFLEDSPNPRTILRWTKVAEAFGVLTVNVGVRRYGGTTWNTYRLDTARLRAIARGERIDPTRLDTPRHGPTTSGLVGPLNQRENPRDNPPPPEGVGLCEKPRREAGHQSPASGAGHQSPRPALAPSATQRRPDEAQADDVGHPSPAARTVSTSATSRRAEDVHAIAAMLARRGLGIADSTASAAVASGHDVETVTERCRRYDSGRDDAGQPIRGVGWLHTQLTRGKPPDEIRADLARSRRAAADRQARRIRDRAPPGLPDDRTILAALRADPPPPVATAIRRAIEAAGREPVWAGQLRCRLTGLIVWEGTSLDDAAEEAERLVNLAVKEAENQFTRRTSRHAVDVAESTS